MSFIDKVVKAFRQVLSSPKKKRRGKARTRPSRRARKKAGKSPSKRTPRKTSRKRKTVKRSPVKKKKTSPAKRKTKRPAKKKVAKKVKKKRPVKRATGKRGGISSSGKKGGRQKEEAPGELVGVITHYFSRIQVAVLKVNKGTLNVGDEILVKGKGYNFKQKIKSLQIESVDVKSVRKGQLAGLKVDKRTREGDQVYKVL